MLLRSVKCRYSYVVRRVVKRIRAIFFIFILDY